MKKIAKIYKGFAISTDDELYEVVGMTTGDNVEVRRYDFEAEKFEDETVEKRKAEVARDLRVDMVFFELTTEEKEQAITEHGLSIMTGSLLNDVDRDENGNRLSRHYSNLYYVADNAGKLETWEQDGEITFADAVEKAYELIQEGEI